MTLAVETRGLTRRYGRVLAVDALDLRVERGRVFGFLGLNGAGKTTTLKMLTALLPPTSGEARVMGVDVARDPLGARRQVGYVGDEAGESRPSWTAREYVAYFARLRGAGRDEVDARLEDVGLERAWRDRPLARYSAGMKRRVELARALLGAPPVLFLDEPTRGLDLPAKRQLWSLLRALSREKGVTVFVSSHETDEIQALCDDIAVLRRGRLAHVGPAAALAAAPEGLGDRLASLLTG